MMGKRKTKDKMAFWAKHWKMSQRSPKHPLTLVAPQHNTYIFINNILEKGRSEGKKPKWTPKTLMSSKKEKTPTW
jgi:hypothetical protein